MRLPLAELLRQPEYSRLAGCDDENDGHFESTCYHALLLFNREGDCLAAKLLPGYVPSAEECRRHRSNEGRFRAVGASGAPKLATCAVSGEMERS